MDDLSVLLQDVKSIIDQIEQLENGEKQNQVEMQDDEEMDYVEPKDEEKPNEEEVEMQDDEEEDGIEKSAEGSTASDDADERLLDDLELEDESIEVVKNLMKKGIISLKPMAFKSKQIEALTASLGDLAKVVKSLHEKEKANSEAIENVIKGLGLANSIQKSYEMKKAPKRKPVASYDKSEIDSVMKSLESMVEKKVEKSAEEESVRKSLGGVMHGLLGLKKSERV